MMLFVFVTAASSVLLSFITTSVAATFIGFGHTNSSSSSSEIITEILQNDIIHGQLSLARYNAFEMLTTSNIDEKDVSRTYQALVDNQLKTDGIDKYLHKIRLSADNNSNNNKKVMNIVRYRHPQQHCWKGNVNLKDDRENASSLWDRCCSSLHQYDENLMKKKKAARSKRTTTNFGNVNIFSSSSEDSSHKDNHNHDCFVQMDNASDSIPMCCDFSSDSLSYLRLPVLRDLSLRIRLPFDHDECYDHNNINIATNKDTSHNNTEQIVIDIEQDGFLRLFDVSIILWPSGYLLSLCVAAPINCGIPELVQAITYRFQNEQKTNPKLTISRMSSPSASSHEASPNDVTTTAIISKRSRTRRPMAIELGSGIGVASASLALAIERLVGDSSHYDVSGNISSFKTRNSTNRSSLPMVVATDMSPHALALTTANAVSNGANVMIKQINHTNITELINLKYQLLSDGIDKEDIAGAVTSKELTHHRFQGGFDIVIGSSLQGLFSGTDEPDALLWTVLDALLSHDNSHAVAILVHTVSERIRTPPAISNYVTSNDLLSPSPSSSQFVCIRRINGDKFGMLTRDGSPSDFEISVFQRYRNSDSRSRKDDNASATKNQQDLWQTNEL